MSELGKDATGDFEPRRFDRGGPPHAPHAPAEDLAVKRRLALEAARVYVLRQQADDGMWHGHATPSVSCTARYVLLEQWLDRGETEMVAAAVEYLRRSGLPQGGWSECGTKQGEFHLDASAMAYLALKIHAGGDEAPRAALASARDAIMTSGGLANCDALSRYWLALFGIIDFSECPVATPESLRWPSYIVDSFLRQGHWVRAIQVPLSVICSQKPIKVLENPTSLDELQLTGEGVRLRRLPRGGCVPNRAAGAIGSGLRILNKVQIKPWKASSLKAATQWIIDNTSGDDGLAGSWDGTMLAIIALVSRGMRRQHPTVSDLLLALQHGLISPNGGRPNGGQPTGDNTNLQAKTNANAGSVCLPAFQSPTLDSAVSIRAIAAMAPLAPEEDSPQLRPAVEWLLSREITAPGDWAYRVSVEPSGWCREFSNRQFASVPATAMVLLALREQFSENPPSSLVTDDSMVAMIRANSLNLAHRQIAVLDRVAAASRRGRRWLLALQNQDGGWGHSQQTVTSGRFRVAAEWQPLQDSSTAASTGRVLQSLGAWEMACGQTSVDQAVSWLRRNQHDDGYWPGQHDAAPLEATCAAMVGLRAVGLPRRDCTLQDAATWCLSVQSSDGGWRCNANPNDAADGRNGTSNSDPLSTAWALMALVAAGHRDAEPVRAGLRWLLEQQQTDGSWDTQASGPRPIDGSGLPLLKIPSLGFRTTILTNAYAMLAIQAFEPFRTARRPSGRHARDGQTTRPVHRR